MSTFAWACWDGGGNLPPSIGIARELESRGHRVRFHGRPDMVARVSDAGLEAVALDEAYTAVERYVFHPQATVFGYTSSPIVGDELIEVIADADPDAIVIDAMFAAALEVADEFNRPTALMLHTFLHSLTDMWQANFQMQSDSRERAGFAPLPGLDVLWASRDLVQVNTLAALDGPPKLAWGNITHGAPVLYCEPRMLACVPPAAALADDIVLVSFSTVPEQRSIERLQRTLDALSTVPVAVVACTGGTIDADDLDVPTNTTVLGPSDHEALIARARVVVGHGGHGTTMRALRAGVPLVCIPATGGDQVPISRRVDEWGVGRALAQDASPDAIRSAVIQVLEDDRFAATAMRLGAPLRDSDGARLAADALEALVR